MPKNVCDICGQPATHFFNSVHCFADGRPGSRSGTQFCDVHVAAHQHAAAQAMLDSMLRFWRKIAAVGGPADQVEIVFDTQNKAAADELAVDVRNAFGGVTALAEWPCGWVVIWHLPATASALDQWQCEGWSPRLTEMVRRHHGRLSGFTVPIQRR